MNIRVEGIKSHKVEEAIQKSNELQDQLWQQAEALADANPNSIMLGLFIHSLNEVIDLHAERIHVGVRTRIPPVIWISLYLIAIFSISSLGYQVGLVHARYMGITILLILALASVITLIIDLDRPQEGLITVSQQALMDLQTRFNTGNPP